ncbi:MAG: hypothetical protein GXY33_12175 [Phycisphaerae bacterium]|nr:hypothetical protein [Phycisphaerae bacterium]
MKTVTWMVSVLLTAAFFYTALAEDAAEWKVVSELSAENFETLPGWVRSSDRGTVEADGSNLRIESLAGEGHEWAGHAIRYEPGFSIDGATVRIEIDTAGLEIYRDFTIMLYPKDGNTHQEPSVWIHINHGNDNSVCLVRRHREGRNTTVIPPQPLPFKFTGDCRTTLTITNGTAVLEVSRGQATKEIVLLDLIPKQWLIHPFTVEVGTSQHGNPAIPATVLVRRVRILTSNLDEATAEETVGNGPGKSGAVTYIYLDEVANRRFEDDKSDDGAGGWTDQGANDLRFIPRGYQFFRNVPFHINDRLEVVGNAPRPACILLRGKHTPLAPLAGDPIQVNAAAPFLYFLHTAAWGGSNIHMADYVIHYADGGTETIPLRSDHEIADWWEPRDDSARFAHVAWVGQNLEKGFVGFYLYEWKNPHPQKPVSHIVFRSTDSAATPVCIAITASDAPIEIGPEPRRHRMAGYTLCEYRQRAKTALKWTAGPTRIVVQRRLPIAANSDVKQARIDVVRYRAETPASASCEIAGVVKSIQLDAGDLRGQFLFTEPAVLEYLTSRKDGFEIAATVEDATGIGQWHYEANPRHHFIPDGEDFEHGLAAVTGVFQVTPFLPEHVYSGYVELKPAGVEAPPAEVVETALAPAAQQPEWLGGQLCLNGQWQWQPGKVGDDGTAIPADDWRPINVPCDVGDEIFNVNEDIIGAWFRKSVYCPSEWSDKRITIEFQAVADFATVFCNGEKVDYHEGILPFKVDLTDRLRFGRDNTICLFAENVYKGIIPLPLHQPMASLAADVSHYKGHAYRLTMVRGAYDQKPDEVEILLDGQNIARKTGSANQVAVEGDGLYHRQLEWDHSVLFFSTPGNAPFERIKDRLVLHSIVPGVTRHFSRGDSSHHWRTHRPRQTGPYRDVFLNVTGRSRIADVFVKTSVRDMALDVDLELADLPESGAVLAASVRDASRTVLDLGSTPLAASDTRIALRKPWSDPEFWGPGNPYLYFLEVQLTDADGRALDRRFTRFGFREFRVDGVDFVFNGQKPFHIQGESIAAWELPFHRCHLRWHYADHVQQANVNMLRFHKGGMLFPENLDLADEMGMLICQESNFSLPADAVGDDGLPNVEQAMRAVGWVCDQVRNQRNHPSCVMWSTENEFGSIRETTDVDESVKRTAEIQLRLDGAVKEIDPTRPVVNNGGHTFLYTDAYKDDRVDVIDGHYVQPRFFSGWKEKYGKPVTLGEVSLGGDFGWTYQGEVRSLRQQGQDPRPHFWRRLNAATLYMAGRIQAFRAIDVAGIWPFASTKRYHPFISLWDGADYSGASPEIAWPAQSGEQIKRKHIIWGRGTYNFFDPAAPRATYLRTYDALKDNFDEVPKLEPRFSPEVIVQILDPAGKPMADTPVWLIPTDQPGAPIGVVADAEGKAWFWCKSGAGEYTAMVRANGREYQAAVTPAPVGEWLQVKTVVVRIPQ